MFHSNVVPPILKNACESVEPLKVCEGKQIAKPMTIPQFEVPSHQNATSTTNSPNHRFSFNNHHTRLSYGRIPIPIIRAGQRWPRIRISMIYHVTHIINAIPNLTKILSILGCFFWKCHFRFSYIASKITSVFCARKSIFDFFGQKWPARTVNFMKFSATTQE